MNVNDLLYFQASHLPPVHIACLSDDYDIYSFNQLKKELMDIWRETIVPYFSQY